ncbi:MAG: N-acetylmuramoyl-L-alanine amidase [candidate division KSB1 bacterium]|nr:N-acetylmuramoyl-L-alanine amidase [candidate division KSB1 bacterium]MDZ7367439.1 N-acetylmuramoyl-L-alanine amidase [candidate division KSB1 bacterium]
MLLVFAANEWGCGAKPMPRPTNTARESKRPLYPLSSDSEPRQKPMAEVEPVERTPAVSPSRSDASKTSSGDVVSRPPVSGDRQNIAPSLSHPELTFQKNAAGEREAVYHLKKGEALYSAVVVRFTGRVDADEVNAIAQKLLEYNGIGDATKITAGTPIRIPARFLDEEILRGKTPAAINRSASPSRPRSARPGRQPRSELHVILDAGHGGSDPGTIVRGWVEDEIAYDLMLRIKRGLQERGVKVYSTVRDKQTGDRIDGLLANNRDEYVKVTPEYYMADSRVALNLRIYLIEDLYRWMLRRGIPAENIFMISIHLDHLHPALGGAMAYYPGAAERASQFKAGGSIYRYYQESRLETIHFNRRESENAEDASKAFALDLIENFRRARIPVHDYQPVRSYVYRRDHKWTPGIIRYSRVPVSILLEAANLSNRNDLGRIRSASFRQGLAEVVVRTIMAQE